VGFIAYNSAVMATSNGVTTWSHFRSAGLYLHYYPTPPAGDTNAQAALPLDTSPPTATTLYNYDLNYSVDPGRKIVRSSGSLSETALNMYQNWTMYDPILEFDTVKGKVPSIVHVSGDTYAIAYQGDGDDGFLKTLEILSDGTIGNMLELDGDVWLVIWSGVADFVGSARGVVKAYLRDFDGLNYTEIANATLDVADWEGGSASWVEKIIIFTNVSYTVPAGNHLEVRVLVHADSYADMWFAYDTTGNLFRIELP